MEESTDQQYGPIDPYTLVDPKNMEQLRAIAEQYLGKNHELNLTDEGLEAVGRILQNRGASRNMGIMDAVMALADQLGISGALELIDSSQVQSVLNLVHDLRVGEGKEVLQRIKSDREIRRLLNREPIRNEGPRVGKNEKCPCGSGEKFKNCHGARKKK